MAHPLRWVLIGLSVRLQIPIHEIETWKLPVIREYMAYLSKPADRPTQQSPEEIAESFTALLSTNNK